MRSELKYGNRLEVDEEEHTGSSRYWVNLQEHVRENERIIERKSSEKIKERKKAIPTLSIDYSGVAEAGD